LRAFHFLAELLFDRLLELLDVAAKLGLLRPQLGDRLVLLLNLDQQRRDFILLAVHIKVINYNQST
jgi:hypothetical protein